MKRHKQAFTLIELLVVVLIIGVLVSVAVPMYQKAVRKARATGAWTAMKATADAMNLYYTQHGEYPASLDDLDVEATKIKGFSSVGSEWPGLMSFQDSISLASLYGSEGGIALVTEEENGDCSLEYEIVNGKVRAIISHYQMGSDPGDCAWLNPCSSNNVSGGNCPFEPVGSGTDIGTGTGTGTDVGTDVGSDYYSSPYNYFCDYYNSYFCGSYDSYYSSYYSYPAMGNWSFGPEWSGSSGHVDWIGDPNQPHMSQFDVARYGANDTGAGSWVQTCPVCWEYFVDGKSFGSIIGTGDFHDGNGYHFYEVLLDSNVGSWTYSGGTWHFSGTATEGGNTYPWSFDWNWNWSF